LPRLAKYGRRLSALGLLAALSVTAAACGSSDDSSSTSTPASTGAAAATSTPAATTAAPETKDVNFMLEWTPNASQVWAIAGKEQGIFQKDGINPKFLFPDSETSPTKVLLAGKADYVLQLSNSAVTARGTGAKIKVIGTLEVLDIGVMSLADKISTPADLKGKTIGIGPDVYGQTCIDRLLKNNGMTRDDVKIVDPGFNLVGPLVAGKFDGVNASQYEQAITLAKTGAKTNIFPFNANGCPNNPIQIVTTEKKVQEDPEEVKAVLKGIADSLNWSIDPANEAAATKVLDDKYPDLEYKSDFAQWQASGPTFCTADSMTKGLLYSDPKQYQDLIQLSKDGGAIKAAYPASDLVDNSLLPDPPVNSSCANDRYKDDPLSQITGL
jgi:ABC-type nitrate/sulfonate/bicarbonate transport system substrate-binding protein